MMAASGSGFRVLGRPDVAEVANVVNCLH